jgi:PAS domain S-box-containing protein
MKNDVETNGEPMNEPSLFSEEEETLRLAEELLASGVSSDSSWPSHYRTLVDKYNKLLAQSRRLMKIGDLMQNELNRLNEQMRRTEEKYRLIFENSPIGVLHFDSAGSVLACNPHFVHISGAPSEKIIGLNLVTDLNDPDLTAAVREALSGGIGHYEGTYTSVKGTKTTTIKGEFASIASQNGAVVGGIGIVEDISERKKSEEAIVRAKEEWERTFDTVPDLIMLLDRDFTIVRANKATLEKLGLTSAELVGTRCFAHFHNTDVPPSHCPHAQHLDDGEPHTAEIFEPHLGGTFAVSVSPIRDKDGHVVACVHVAHDITRRKLAEDQIKAALREKEVLLREVHHRVKNNFQMIAGLLMLQADQIGDADTQGALKQTEARVLAMARVHEKMYQSGHLGEIKMDEYLSELAEDLIGFHESASQRVVFTRHMEPVTAAIDTAIPCGLILTELVTNAMKHAFPNGAEGTVEISLREIVEHGYELMVRDDGIGLPEGFTLGQNASLGLKLVQAFAKRSRAVLTVERENGTAIRIRFKRD